MLLRGATKLLPDASRRHGNLSVKSLDWFDALAQDRVPEVRASLNAIKPDLVLGADIVSHSLTASQTFFSANMRRPVVSSRPDWAIPCYLKNRAASNRIFGRWNSVCRADGPQC